MSERLHPDGLPIDRTPWIDRLHDEYCAGGISNFFSTLLPLEFRAREAEARVAELELEVAWLRGGMFTLYEDEGGYRNYSAFDVDQHLTSRPPEGWTP